MRILVSAGWLGGAGGAERAVHSVLRALADDHVDVVVRQRLGGPLSRIPQSVRVQDPLGWRWRWAAVRTGPTAGFARALNVARRRLPAYDVYLQFFHGAYLAPAARAGVSILVPSGQDVPPEVAARFDAVGLQAPNNAAFVPPGTRTLLLPPPLFDVADMAERPPVDLPEKFYLSVFNPYGAIKGVDDFERAVRTTPVPIVWCHSRATLEFAIPEALTIHPKVVHVEDPTPAQLRWLYENCLAYLSFSKREGFGWSSADALRYSAAVVTRETGIFSFSEARQPGVHLVLDDWSMDWARLPDEPGAPKRDMEWIKAERFRERLCEALP